MSIGPSKFEPFPFTCPVCLRHHNGMFGKYCSSVCEEQDKSEPLKVQVGGDHYKKLKIQPIEYILANKIPYCEGNIIKYITRWRDKGGIKDLEKVKHYVDILIYEETK
jgi:hypothetical protein